MRSRLRYSLRGLLCLTAILAVWLAIVSARTHRQRVAIRVLEAAGASLTTELDGPTWLRGLIGDDFFRRVVEVKLVGKDLDDHTMSAIGDLRELRSLRIYNTTLPAGGLQRLKALSNLRELMLVRCEIPDGSFRIADSLPSVESLFLGGSNVDDAMLESVTGFPQLQVLMLQQTPVTDRGLVHLAGLSELRALVLSETTITGEALGSLVRCKHLGNLDLANTSLNDAGLATMPAFRELTMLYLDHTDVTSVGVCALPELPELVHVSLAGTHVDGDALEFIASRTNVENLTLEYTFICDADLARVPQITRLKQVYLMEARVTPTEAQFREWELPGVGFNVLKHPSPMTQPRKRAPFFPVAAQAEP